MSEQNKKVALDFITAMGKGDAKGYAACLNTDAVTVAKGFGKLSGTRTYEQAVGTADALKKLWVTGLNPAIKTVTAEGERVVVEFEGDAKLPNGKPYCNQYVMVFTCRGGKISQVNEYYCTILADQAMLPVLADLGMA
jgi:ketosteroid isomerase-like protein